MDQQEMQITHPVTIPASVELLVWVVLGSRRPLYNRRHLAERAQRLSLSRSSELVEDEVPEPIVIFNRPLLAFSCRRCQPAAAAAFIVETGKE